MQVEHGFLLGATKPPDPAANAFANLQDPRVLAIDALLPQTQCGQCGYTGCMPYARAIAEGSAPINRCPPGGAAGIAALAQLLGQPVRDLDPACGDHRPLHVARIDESCCIGCTLCILACPVDAIAGAIKRMHTVIPADCTGCDLCLAPCPMDCIEMIPVDPPRDWTRPDADRARGRMHERNARLLREKDENDARLETKARHKLDELQRDESLAPGSAADGEVARRKAIIEQALARVRQRRSAGRLIDATPLPDSPDRSQP